MTLVLDGNTSIKKGITCNRFETVPDVPVSSFVLYRPDGKYSILGANVPTNANYDFCGQKLTMGTTITGQNGAVIKQTTKIGITGCPKAHPKTRLLAESESGWRRREGRSRGVRG